MEVEQAQTQTENILSKRDDVSISNFFVSHNLEFDASVQHISCGSSVAVQTNEIPQLQTKVMCTSASQTQIINNIETSMNSKSVLLSAGD